jgi:hypothetical protein
MKALLCAGLAATLAAGCASPAGRAARVGPIFPDGEYAAGAEAPERVCPSAAETFRELARRRAAGPPPIPGHDAPDPIVTIADRTKVLEVVAVAFEDYPYGRPLHVAFAGEDDLSIAQVDGAGERPISARVLVRLRVPGGLYDGLSYCFEKFAVLAGRVDGPVTLVLEDGRDVEPPRWWNVARFDPPSVEEIERVGSHTEDPVDD